MPIWGIDLGGTKIEGVVLENLEDPKVLCRKRIPTEREKGYEHILDRIQLLVNSISNEVGFSPDKIGIGTPGTLDPVTQAIKNSNTVVLNGKPLMSDLQEKLKVPLKMANDANCLVLAETRMGAVKTHMPDARVVFGLIMGTGIGGGIVINGEVLEGKHGIGGEWGHNYLDHSGGACYCGKHGCVETVISGKALEQYHFNAYGEKKRLKNIYEEHVTGRFPNSSATIERLLHFFAKGIAVVINILDPDVIVIGGGVGNIDLLYEQGTKKVTEHIFNDHVNTVFLKPELGDSAGVFGAAMLTEMLP